MKKVTKNIAKEKHITYNVHKSGTITQNKQKKERRKTNAKNKNTNNDKTCRGRTPGRPALQRKDHIKNKSQRRKKMQNAKTIVTVERGCPTNR